MDGYCSTSPGLSSSGTTESMRTSKGVFGRPRRARAREENLKAGMTGGDGTRSRGTISNRRATGSISPIPRPRNRPEYPRISLREKGRAGRARKRMVFSDEPGVYLAGEYGVRIEDTVTLKDGKVSSFMHKTDRNLVIL
ncbi:MAG: M24 family metallopeptidase [Christensenellaceae bacterium]